MGDGCQRCQRVCPRAHQSRRARKQAIGARIESERPGNKSERCGDERKCECHSAECEGYHECCSGDDAEREGRREIIRRGGTLGRRGRPHRRRQWTHGSSWPILRSGSAPAVQISSSLYPSGRSRSPQRCLRAAHAGVCATAQTYAYGKCLCKSMTPPPRGKHAWGTGGKSTRGFGPGLRPFPSCGMCAWVRLRHDLLHYCII